MTGSPLYSIEQPASFERSFKKLVKCYRQEAIELLITAFEDLTIEPFPAKSRDEPLPSKTRLLEG